MLFADTETTGLNPMIHDIISLSYIIVDGENVHPTKTLIFRPFNMDTIEEKALQINGFTRQELVDAPLAYDVFFNFLIPDLECHMGSTKYFLNGFNTPFDQMFIRQLFQRCYAVKYPNADTSKYMDSFFQYKYYDTMQLCMAHDYATGCRWPNHKLITAAKFFGFAHDAHNSASDIKVTKKIWDLLIQGMKKSYV